MNKRLILGLLLGTALLACNKKNSYYEGKDRDFEIKMVKIENAAGETSGTNYSARIIPDKALQMINNTDWKTSMMYKMDSCFYIQGKQKKIYPGLVQAVANGLSGQFEYMVSFDDDNNAGADPVMIYQDKYLNKKKYTLTVKD